MGRLLILTGFMGVGKSATGRALARRLDWRFVDLDEVVEGVAGKSVAQIFAEDGEEHFRGLEAAALARVLDLDRAVIATGGGVLGREENRKRLAGRLVVHLHAPLAECLRRARGSGTARPLLAAGDEAVERLYEARRPGYREMGYEVETLGKGPEAVAEEIAARFLGEGGVGAS